MIVAVLCMVLGGVALSAYVTIQKLEMTSQEIGMIDENSLTEVDEFSRYFELAKGGGKYINFWAKNTGRNDIAITINDKERRVIKTGDSGHISVKAGTLTKRYAFDAEPTPNGGRISLDYRIAQRDELVDNGR